MKEGEDRGRYIRKMRKKKRQRKRRKKSRIEA